MGILEIFGFPFFMSREIRKLEGFYRGMWLTLPFIGNVTNTYAHLLWPCCVLRGHCFARSKIAKSKLQKNGQLSMQKTPVRELINEQCRSHGDHAKGMEAMAKAWRPCQGHRNHVKGMVTMRKECYYAKGMEIMPKARRPCQRHGDHAISIVTMLKA